MAALTGTWERISLEGLSDHLAARSSHCLAVLKHKAYIFGGELEPRTPIGNELIIVDLEDGKTRILDGASSARWPSARVGASMVSHAGSNALYLWGGRGGKEMQPIEVKTSNDESDKDDVWKFDVNAEIWSKLDTQASEEAAFPEARSYHTMTISGNCLYVHAGCPSKGRLGKLNMLDLTTKQWKSLPDAPDPPRGGTAITALRAEEENKPDLLIRWGGFCGHELGGPLDIFDPVSASWKSHEITIEGSKSEPAKRSVHGLVPIRKLRRVKTESGEKEAVAILLMGEGEGAPAELGHDGAGKFLNDAYALLRNDGSYSWQPISIATADDTPTPRGWFGSDVYESNEGDTKIVIYGGLQESNERLSDAWILHIK